VDTLDFAVSAAQKALLLSMQVSLPILAVGLLVGFLMSILQAVTQIQEQMLSFIPKIVAMVGVLLVLLPWLLSVMATYTQEILVQLRLVAAS